MQHSAATASLPRTVRCTASARSGPTSRRICRSPQNDAETIITIHRARTEAQSIKFDLRAYLHRWLTEHSLPWACQIISPAQSRAHLSALSMGRRHCGEILAASARVRRRRPQSHE